MSTVVGDMRSMCCHMALVLVFKNSRGIFNFRLFLSILFYIKTKTGIETSDQNGPLYQHLLPSFAMLSESNTEKTNIRIMFIYVVRLYNVHVLYCISCSPNAYYILLVQALNQ